MVWYDASNPMSPVATTISVTVPIRAARRPRRSPMWPKITAPTGRATKPNAEVTSEAMTPMTGSSAGKNSAGKTKATAVAQMK